MEQICSFKNCQIQPEVLCKCENKLLCREHAMSHPALPGAHQYEKLYIDLNPEAKKLLINQLFRFITNANELMTKTISTAQAITEKIYSEVSIIKNELIKMRNEAYKALKKCQSLTSISKFSNNYIDILLQKPLSEISAEYDL